MYTHRDHSSRHETRSNKCIHRRLFLTFGYFIIYLNYDISVLRTASFTMNTYPQPVSFHRRQGNQRLELPLSNQKSLPLKHLWYLNAIALPPTSTTDSQLLDSITGSTNVNGYSSVAKQQEVQQPNVGVLLLNLGGPETGDDVEGKIAASAV